MAYEALHCGWWGCASALKMEAICPFEMFIVIY